VPNSVIDAYNFNRRARAGFSRISNRTEPNLGPASFIGAGSASTHCLTLCCSPRHRPLVPQTQD
jgi:hypothetical protein